MREGIVYVKSQHLEIPSHIPMARPACTAVRQQTLISFGPNSLLLAYIIFFLSIQFINSSYSKKKRKSHDGFGAESLGKFLISIIMK